MSCLVLDIERAEDKHVIREMGFFKGNVQGYSLRHPKDTNPQNKFFSVQELCMEFCGKVEVFFQELQNVLHRIARGEFFAKRTGKGKTLGSLMEKEVIKFDDHGWAKSGDLVDPTGDEEKLIGSSYLFRHKSSLHCRERRAKYSLVGQCSSCVCMFCFVLCIVSL